MSNFTLDNLITLLELEPIELNLFRGHSPDTDSQRVFGGQVIAQALRAAYETVEGRLCHSLHAYFIRPGDPSIPILYEVDRSRDGGSFTTRRVIAIQHGKQIFNLAASFQIDEDGVDHQMAMPTDLPGPDGLDNEFELRQRVRDQLPGKIHRGFWETKPIDIRPIEPQDYLDPKPMAPMHRVWMRADGTMGDDPVLNHCVLAYASDYTLLEASVRAHGLTWINPKLQSASLDHAIWFHRPFCMDDWLLYEQEAPSASGARGFNRGQIYAADGALVASVAQEGLVRLRKG